MSMSSINMPLILSLCLLSPSFTDDETKLCLPQCRYLTLQRHGKCPFLSYSSCWQPGLNIKVSCHFFFFFHKPICSWKKIRHQCEFECLIKRQNTLSICIFSQVISGGVVTWQFRDRATMNYLLKWVMGCWEVLKVWTVLITNFLTPDDPITGHLTYTFQSLQDPAGNFLPWQLNSRHSFRQVQQLGNQLIVSSVKM